jgi:Class II Aldolase and Adducin N-terminal domain
VVAALRLSDDDVLLRRNILGRDRTMPDGQYLRNTDVSAVEWRARCELAALYHVCNYLGWTDLINTHMSVRVPGEPDHFLINRYGEMFDEITASSLVKMDFDGNVIGPEGSFNNAGFTIHSGVYKRGPTPIASPTPIPAPAPVCHSSAPTAFARSARTRCRSMTISLTINTVSRRPSRNARNSARPAPKAAASYCATTVS